MSERQDATKRNQGALLKGAAEKELAMLPPQGMPQRTPEKLSMCHPLKRIQWDQGSLEATGRTLHPSTLP
ncbi:hypothetical protein NDU88_000914 [Pleurodeles waltl]|uniref:Uncharacterized protein n=1 Tax=Pleurodeles waltl TaxID=8319 RepID=A0AAV7WJY5_PLEWA|nr:hypothetical protein NDU88_000914 [Pleurodeles waltl]